VVAAIGIITERAPYALTRGATLRGVRIGPESFWIVRTEKEVGLGKWLFENIRTIAPPRQSRQSSARETDTPDEDENNMRGGTSRKTEEYSCRPRICKRLKTRLTL